MPETEAVLAGLDLLVGAGQVAMAAACLWVMVAHRAEAAWPRGRRLLMLAGGLALLMAANGYDRVPAALWRAYAARGLRVEWLVSAPVAAAVSLLGVLGLGVIAGAFWRWRGAAAWAVAAPAALALGWWLA